MKNSKWTALAVLGVVLYACSPKVATTTAPPKVVIATTETVTETILTPELAKGKSLYEDSCANCHKLFPASKHDKEGWVVTLDRMAPKAKITEEEKVLIYNYLVAGL
ncbi:MULTISPECIES: cytochrome C [unclassified Flavobacterium]|uniref:cytochrome C n=1 Tax=unclassified Flavobacterium TaxID=196869 RepID=UPI003623B162